ncbi:MAG: hypothetical protein ACP5XB_23635 [Isosphaeraceae bacterium]
MRKAVIQLGHEIHEERPRSRWPLFLLVVFLVLGLGPLALEGGAVCVANWKEFMGISAEARTPILDRARDSLHDLNETCNQQFRSWFRVLPWEPRMVLAVAGVIMGLAMLMLRR